MVANKNQLLRPSDDGDQTLGLCCLRGFINQDLTWRGDRKQRNQRDNSNTTNKQKQKNGMQAGLATRCSGSVTTATHTEAAPAGPQDTDTHAKVETTATQQDYKVGLRTLRNLNLRRRRSPAPAQVVQITSAECRSSLSARRSSFLYLCSSAGFNSPKWARSRWNFASSGRPASRDKTI